MSNYEVDKGINKAVGKLHGKKTPYHIFEHCSYTIVIREEKIMRVTIYGKEEVPR